MSRIVLAVLCMASALGGTYGLDDGMGNHGNDPLVRGGASTPRPWLAPSPTPEQAEVPELWDDTGLQRPMSSVLAEGIVAPAAIAAAIRAYDWDWDEAERVQWCEWKPGDPLVSATGDYGVFQINAIHRNRVGGDLSLLLDVETNVRVAHEIWSEQGWVPWRWSRSCHGL